MRTLFPVTLLTAFLAVTAAPAQVRHVVVISIDGFPARILRDPALPFTTLHRMAREGAIADGMTPVNPTVTWPNHTAMVTGVAPDRHGVLYNGLVVRTGEGKAPKIEPWVDKKELVLAPTVYDAARAAGMTTAEIDWVAIYPTSTVTWSFPEQPKPDQPEVREMIADGVVSEDEIRNWGHSPINVHDDAWVRAAAHILEKHKPNLLLLHTLTTDSTHHTYGPDSLAGNTALILADRNVAQVLAAIDRAGLRDSTAVLVVSDHGFRGFRHVIHPNAILRERGLLRDAADCDAWTISEGGTAMVYVTRESKRAATAAALREAFRDVPGIARVIPPEEFAAAGYPKWTPGGRMADLVLAAEPGYAFDGAIRGDAVSDVPAGATPGAHGYLNSDPDMQEILVAWGAGIRPGSKLGLVPNVDVAPTIARLLGLPWPAGRGTALTQILSGSPSK
ncbi:MAG: alkaline phosphatase family protein [Acidobacteria bacterium]|nr:alkaline phosphatase family protein [Acidobacteriota bacterium]